ncbi:F-box/LRR-repeat protein 6-like [Pezoporus occidentalis]|uniref:F-box/LRR-repeat protein 6-like n=1 Tax=Pezoporus occidentalis TaxID=407982 RepID=UPI002F91A93B
MAQPRSLQASCPFRQGPHWLRLGLAPSLLHVELEAASTGERWRGDFDAAAIEELTLRTGNFKHFGIFCSMLEAALLQVLHLQALSFSPPCGAPPPPPPRPFRALRELRLGGRGPDAGSGVTDWLLRRLLRAAPRLRTLDLSGCARITPGALLELPAELELLWLGLPGGAEQLPRLSRGSAALTHRWRRSLRDLDLSARSFEEQDLAQAMAALGPDAPLRALNLASTKVSARGLSVLLRSCPALSFLELSGCRRLPRGTKRAHRGRREVRRCLRVMAGLAPDEEAANEGAANEGAANEEATNEGASNEEIPNEKPPNEKPPNEGAPNEKPPSEGAPNEETPNEKPPNEENTNMELDQ